MTNLHLSNYASNLWTIVEARARREVTYYHGIGEKLLLVLTESPLRFLFLSFHRYGKKIKYQHKSEQNVS